VPGISGKGKCFACGGKGYANGPLAKAQFSIPRGIAIDHNSGKIYVSDTGNHRIRVISGGIVAGAAGSGQVGHLDGSIHSATFSAPYGLAVGPKGDVYIADRSNHRIRLLSGTKVSTFAGNGGAGHKDGAAAGAMFSFPSDVAVDSAGVVYVADSLNHRIRKIDKGQVTTIAGSGLQGFLDGQAAKARMNNPMGIAVGKAGRIYVADTNNHRVRLIKP